MTFRFQKLTLDQFRCFEHLELPFEEDLTLIFAENGGGKTAILTALAMGLADAAFQRGAPRSLKLDAQRDARKVTLDERGRREAAGTCVLSWTAKVGEESGITWSRSADPASDRKVYDVTNSDVLAAITKLRVPGARWPLFGFYGVDRMGRGKASTKPPPTRPDRWEGYASALDPSQDDSTLLTWLLEEILADTVRRQNEEQERFFATAVMDAVAKATPGVTRAWYDPSERSPVVRFESGKVVTWKELSDGFHVYLALVTDLARRAVMLNEQDGGDAPSKVEGVVLIDEIDLHLHPRWQRIVLDGLRKIFPRLQFIVTTHSPQVLSSVLNRQVRKLVNAQIATAVHVEGRDTDAILRDQMNVEDDERGKLYRRELYALIDDGKLAEARAYLEHLETKWTDADPEIIRARGLLDDLDDNGAA